MHGLGALMITLSCLSPTFGVFVVGSDVIHQAGTGVFLCFVAAALLGVAMAAVYAELVSAFPETGAEYTLVGRTCGATPGFATLGLILLGGTLGQALSALAIAGYLDVIAPGLQPVPTAVVLMAVVSVIGVLNIRLNALITGAFLSLEVVSLVVLAILGFSHPHRSLAEAAFHPMALSPLGLTPTPIAVLGTTAASAIFAFNGYGSVVSLGEELHDAPRRVAGVIFGALGLAALLQLAPVLAVLVGAPDLTALIGSKTPLPLFIVTVGGPWLGKLMSLGVALAIFNTMIAVSLVTGRLMFSTGRDGVWPGAVNRAMTALHPRFGSPWIGVLFTGALSILCCFVSESLLLTVISGGLVAIYAVLCVAVIAGRRGGATAHAGYRMPLYPLAPAVALIALAGVVWTSLGDEKVGRPGLLITLAVVILSGLLYYVVLRPKGAWAHRGPTLAEPRAAE
jgi:amino acid transporter